MVPEILVAIPEMPVTPHGKVDRKALQGWELASAASVASRPRGAADYRTPAEELIAVLMADVLGFTGIPEIGPTESFFDLGGHSLMATQLVSRVRSAFRVDLPLQEVFAGSSARELAAAVEALQRVGRALDAPPLVPVRGSGDAPLSFAQERLWFLDRMRAGSLYNIPVALELRGRLLRPALDASLSEVFERHEALRTSFPTVAGRPVQRVAQPAPVRLPLADLSGLPEGRREEEARRLAREEASRPFDLERGPLARLALLHLGEARHLALLTVHHIVADAWSMGVLVRELGAAYRAFSRNERPELPELPVQYADFAVWQRSWLSGELLEAEIGHWRERLAGAPAALDLPFDRPRPAVPRQVGGFRTFALDNSLAEGLRALGRRRGSTLFMTLFAALGTLLERHGAGSDLPIGTPIANRNRAETEGLIGFFVNTLVLRTDLRMELRASVSCSTE